MEILQQLLAERDIRRIAALYPQFADDDNAAAFAELFTEDGALVFGAQRIEGRENIAQWLQGTLSGPRMRHLMMNIAINIESEDAASGSLDMVLLRESGGVWSVLASPRYADRYVRTAAGWRFAQRIIDSRNPI